MRVGFLAGAATTLIGGAAFAQTATTPLADPKADQVAPPAASAKPARTERVCKAEPIANSRLKAKKVCMSRAEYERMRNEQKLMVRDQLQRGGVQSNQGGG